MSCFHEIREYVKDIQFLCMGCGYNNTKGGCDSCLDAKQLTVRIEERCTNCSWTNFKKTESFIAYEYLRDTNGDSLIGTNFYDLWCEVQSSIRMHKLFQKKHEHKRMMNSLNFLRDALKDTPKFVKQIITYDSESEIAMVSNCFERSFDIPSE